VPLLRYDSADGSIGRAASARMRHFQRYGRRQCYYAENRKHVKFLTPDAHTDSCNVYPSVCSREGPATV